MTTLTGLLRLMRPANMVTAIADVLAGISIVGYWSAYLNDWYHFKYVLLLSLSTAALYAGGVVFNDVFDAELDKIERPERPIPSGVISRKGGAIAAILLLLAGILLSFFCNNISLLLAVLIAVAAVVYDKWGKHHPLIGPLNMGICRGLNLLLGMSILPGMIEHWWFLALIPVIYIASITMISRGEVHGSNKITLYGGGILYGIVIVAIFAFAFFQKNVLIALVFILFFAGMIFTPLAKAIEDPAGKNIGKAVKAGVLALILMDAGWAAASGNLYAAVIILLLLPLSIVLAKVFAVT